jgi:AcrR family transcriptional regulator
MASGMTTDYLWGGRGATRGPKPALSLERIAEAAIAIADAEGLAAVSMQRVAADLGFTKMSLYRYLPGKAELVALMVERGIGEPPVLRATDWAAGLKQWAHLLLAGYLRHPWALAATVGPRPLGPNELGWMESALALLDGTGLTGAERLDVLAVLTGQVRMIAEHAMPEAHLGRAIAEVLRRHGERFPVLAATMADATTGQDQAFDFGLDRILDGLRVLVDARRPRRGAGAGRGRKVRRSS